MSNRPANDISHARVGFDYVFSNDLEAAKEHFSGKDSPFHLMGLGTVVFLQAALGLERNLITEASRLLALAETRAKQGVKAAKANLELQSVAMVYEVLQADAVLLLGLTQALSESYTGYLQCMYSLNSAHSKFTKIYNTAFPDGVDKFDTPSSTPMPSRNPSAGNIYIPAAPAISPPQKISKGVFSRWTSSETPPPSPDWSISKEDQGVLQELVTAGAAFGYGLFNLVLSLLPPRLKGVVGFFGFKSDRRLALQALAVAATKDDVHGVFAGLTLMTYYGAVLSLSGYQADEAHILKQYGAIVDKLSKRYPSGSLWILNHAKIVRMSYDPENAISILRAGLAPDRPLTFAQADSLLIFELAWTLMAQRRYDEAARMFLKMTEVNSWSHGTYYFIAAGCYISLGHVSEAKRLLDAIPDLLDKRRIGGRELPMEIFIRKKITFYKKKHMRRTGTESNYVESIRLSTAEEMGLWWSVHARITVSSADAHIHEWLASSPPITISTPFNYDQSEEIPSTPDLDTADEFALRSLLLGVVHRSISHFSESREFLLDVAKHPVEAKWLHVMALFELAVLRLKETEANDKENSEDFQSLWKSALHDAAQLLDQASKDTGDADMSSRLDSRISFLRDEIALKQKIISEQ